MVMAFEAGDDFLIPGEKAAAWKRRAGGYRRGVFKRMRSEGSGWEAAEKGDLGFHGDTLNWTPSTHQTWGSPGRVLSCWSIVLHT